MKYFNQPDLELGRWWFVECDGEVLLFYIRDDGLYQECFLDGVSKGWQYVYPTTVYDAPDRPTQFRRDYRFTGMPIPPLVLDNEQDKARCAACHNNLSVLAEICAGCENGEHFEPSRWLK
jgi:hypothetical protein